MPRENKYECDKCGGTGEEPEASPVRALMEKLDDASDRLEADMESLRELGADGGILMVIGDAIDSLRGEKIRLGKGPPPRAKASASSVSGRPSSPNSRL